MLLKRMNFDYSKWNNYIVHVFVCLDVLVIRDNMKYMEMISYGGVCNFVQIFSVNLFASINVLINNVG